GFDRVRSDKGNIHAGIIIDPELLCEQGALVPSYRSVDKQVFFIADSPVGKGACSPDVGYDIAKARRLGSAADIEETGKGKRLAALSGVPLIAIVCRVADDRLAGKSLKRLVGRHTS